MDWVVDTSDSVKMRVLRGDVVSYLRRHAADEHGLDDSELVVSELITNVGRHASGPVWVAVDWPGVHPTIRVVDVGPGFDLAIELPSADSTGGRGLFRVVGQLSSEQLAECFVRLKHAIDGGFSVVEVTPTTIVLENTRCPFGDVVRVAPALCRMTSSVFGGIAARNVDHGATVRLEERIAVGDAGCRVVIELDPTERPDEASIGHHYSTPTAT